MLSKEQLDKLTDSFSDAEIALQLNVSKASINQWRRKLLVKSFYQKTKKIKHCGKAVNRGCVATKNLSKISISNRYKKPIVTKGSVTFFDEIDTPSKAYFLGLLATDGYISVDEKCVSIALQKRDEKILETLVKETNWHTAVKNKKHDTPQSVVIMCSRHMVSSLKDWGITRKKTYTLEILKPIASNLQAHFVRGVWDGNGWVGERQFTLVSSSEKFLCQIQNMIYQHTNVLLKIGRPTNKKHLTLNGSKGSKKALEWIYENPHPSLDRKAIQFSRFWSN